MMKLTLNNLLSGAFFFFFYQHRPIGGVGIPGHSLATTPLSRLPR